MQQTTELGRLVELNHNCAKNAYSYQHLLAPREAMSLVGLDSRRVIDRKIWEYFCSHRVLVEGIGPHSEGGTVWYQAQASHRIDAHGRIVGYSRPNCEPLPTNIRWGYNPESVAALRRVRDAQLHAYEPNLADSLGLTVWKVGTDRLMSLSSDAEPAARPIVVNSDGEAYEVISDELFDWPADRDEQIKALYAKLIESGTVTQLAPAFELESHGIQFSPVFEMDPDAPLCEPLNLQSEIEALGILPTGLGRMLELRDGFLSAYEYRAYRLQRGYLKDLVRKNCKYCGRLFETEDGRRRACDECWRGSANKPRPEFETARKRKQRAAHQGS